MTRQNTIARHALFFATGMCSIFLFPEFAHASGMEGLAILVFFFLSIPCAFFGAMLKSIFPVPAMQMGHFKKTAFAVALFEIIFLAFSIFLGIGLLQGDITDYGIEFYVVSLAFYLVLATGLNLTFFREKNQSLAKTVSKAFSIMGAALFSLLTPLLTLGLAFLIAN